MADTFVQAAAVDALGKSATLVKLIDFEINQLVKFQSPSQVILYGHLNLLRFLLEPPEQPMPV